jgi:hypothetical protein
MVWLLLGGVALTTVQADEKPTVKRQRAMVVLKYGDAKALAETITKHFKGEGEVQVLAEPATNALLINAPEKITPEVVKLVGELDKRPRSIAIDVFIADLNTKKGEDSKIDRKTMKGPSAEIRKRVEELRKKGVITGARRFRLTVTENEPGTLTTSETKPSVTGVLGGPAGFGGPAGRAALRETSRSISYRELGTTVNATVRLIGDREAQINLSVQDSRIRRTEGGVVIGKDDNGAPIYATEFINSLLKSKLSVPLGHTTPVQITDEESTSGQVQTLVLVSLRVVEPSGKDD